VGLLLLVPAFRPQRGTLQSRTILATKWFNVNDCKAMHFVTTNNQKK
jgi:hypothetical protein